MNTYESNNQDLNVLMNLRRLRYIKRCNNFPTVISEDVAQHSYFVSILAMAIADEYNAIKGKVVSVEVVMRKALLHDSDEAYTSDIPWNIKHMSEEFHSYLTDTITRRMNKVYSECTDTFQCYNQYSQTCKSGIEGVIVNLADNLELGMYCCEEYQMGNFYLKDMIVKAVQLAQDTIEAIPELARVGVVTSIMNILQEVLDGSLPKSLLSME